MTDLWGASASGPWETALASYPAVVERQGVAKLPTLDAWYHRELPVLIAARPAPHITHDEMVRITEWKMHRGVWRARTWCG